MPHYGFPDDCSLLDRFSVPAGLRDDSWVVEGDMVNGSRFPELIGLTDGSWMTVVRWAKMSNPCCHNQRFLNDCGSVGTNSPFLQSSEILRFLRDSFWVCLMYFSLSISAFLLYFLSVSYIKNELSFFFFLFFLRAVYFTV